MISSVFQSIGGSKKYPSFTAVSLSRAHSYTGPKVFYNTNNNFTNTSVCHHPFILLLFSLAKFVSLDTFGIVICIIELGLGFSRSVWFLIEHKLISVMIMIKLYIFSIVIPDSMPANRSDTQPGYTKQSCNTLTQRCIPVAGMTLFHQMMPSF